MTAYTTRFFESMQGGSQKSAQVVVPMLVDLLNPESVVDIGCGSGAWLSVFQEYGLDILGVDEQYVLDLASLQIQPDCFQSADLSKPLNLGKAFDLVISLEVAEHIDAESADRFIDNLVSCGSIIFFSAAIPLQGGT